MASEIAFDRADVTSVTLGERLYDMPPKPGTMTTCVRIGI